MRAARHERPSIELAGPPTTRRPRAADDDPTRVCSAAELAEALARSAAAAEREPAITLKEEIPVEAAEPAQEEIPVEVAELAWEEPAADAEIEVDVDVEALSEPARSSAPPDSLPPLRSRRWVRWVSILGLGAALAGILVGLVAHGEALLDLSAAAPAPAPISVPAPVPAPVSAPVSECDSVSVPVSACAPDSVSAPVSACAPDSVSAPVSDRVSAPKPAMTRSP